MAATTSSWTNMGDVIVKRDDYHIFGAAPTVGDLPRLLSEMREQLCH